LVSRSKADLEDISRKVSARPRQEGVVFGEYLPNGIFLAYGMKSLAGEMLELAGGAGQFPAGGILSAESLLDADPEVLVLIHMLKDEKSVSAHLDEIRRHPILSKLRAVQNGRVHPLPLADVHCGGARIPGGVRKLAAFLHPEIFDAPQL
ncbi:MAG: ABC transporter substrate-binding protein, partial [Deltaproteobacteria bacterium]|nr:ABC transporter substrate-binding protein [Deltaproteobacteria bacterium]